MERTWLLSPQHVAEPPGSTSYQLRLQPHADIRSPEPAFIAALGEQFDQAASLAGGRLCVTVPMAVAGDDTQAAVETLLRAAATRRAAGRRDSVRVRVDEAHYTDDGHCHVFAHCETDGRARD